MAHDSLPELELHNVRTRERIGDTVAEIRRRSDVPARTRLALAKTRQRWHRDPTPLVALGLTAVAGIASIVIGFGIRDSPRGRLDSDISTSDALVSLQQRQTLEEQRKRSRKRLAKVSKRTAATRKQTVKRSKNAAKG